MVMRSKEVLRRWPTRWQKSAMSAVLKERWMLITGGIANSKWFNRLSSVYTA